MKFAFRSIEPFQEVSRSDWLDWKWQQRHALKSLPDFEQWFELSKEERRGFTLLKNQFRFQTTPFYAATASRTNPLDPVRRIFMPHADEGESLYQEMLDPLGERQNNPAPRIIHRYPDRVLFLPTDLCSVYCRYCTRKHFTAKDQAYVNKSEYEQAVEYLRSATGVREVILSGGDPLTLGDTQLERIASDLRGIEHVEIIRTGPRIPIVNPMRVTDDLIALLKPHHPIYVMVHFNHPKEITAEAAEAITKLVDNGFPVFNQMVFLNGINNHPAIVQALSRRLMALRVKPYYMFQADPSLGTDHLRTSLEQSLDIQRQLWGRLSGLAMPNLSLDIPNGGGKVGFTPDFAMHPQKVPGTFRGWDGVEAEYVSPPMSDMKTPEVDPVYMEEWERLS